VRVALKALKPLSDQFDSIAFSGMSGAIIAPLLANRLKKELILVRKKGDKDGDASGFTLAKSYVIVDDFIDTGDTTRRIRHQIKKWNPKAKCLGVLEVQGLEEVLILITLKRVRCQ
jgi:adenine/guanine phosphoribosyltransferase-like PRPP-binding protein